MLKACNFHATTWARKVKAALDHAEGAVEQLSTGIDIEKWPAWLIREALQYFAVSSMLSLPLCIAFACAKACNHHQIFGGRVSRTRTDQRPPLLHGLAILRSDQSWSALLIRSPLLRVSYVFQGQMPIARPFWYGDRVTCGHYCSASSQSVPVMCSSM